MLALKSLLSTEKTVRKTNYFTLIEIMIVMTIMISLIGVVGYNVREGWRAQAFSSQVDRLASEIRMSQDMLMLLNIETTMEFEKGEVLWVPVGSINQAYEKMLNREKFELTSISQVVFESELGDNMAVKGKEGKITLSFLDRGFRMPFGVLKMTSIKGEEAFIFLKGYPSPITVLKSAPDVTKERDKERDYRELLTQSTWSELNVQKQK